MTKPKIKNTPTLSELLKDRREVVVEPACDHNRLFCPTSRTPWFEGPRLAIGLHPTESHCAIVLAPPHRSAEPGTPRRIFLAPIGRIRIAKVHRRLRPKPPTADERAMIAREMSLPDVGQMSGQTARKIVPFDGEKVRAVA